MDAEDWRRCFAYARKLGASTADAKDIAQDVMLKSLRRKFNDSKHFERWTVVVTRNLYFSQYRHSKIHQRLSHIFKPTLSSVECAGDLTIEIEETEELLDALNDNQRQIVMQIVTGYQYEEIAEALHIPVGTVKSRLHRAREALLSA